MITVIRASLTVFFLLIMLSMIKKVKWNKKRCLRLGLLLQERGHIFIMRCKYVKIILKYDFCKWHQTILRIISSLVIARGQYYHCTRQCSRLWNYLISNQNIFNIKEVINSLFIYYLSEKGGGCRNSNTGLMFNFLSFIDYYDIYVTF